MAHFAIGLTGGEVCGEDLGEDFGETRLAGSDVEIVPI